MVDGDKTHFGPFLLDQGSVVSVMGPVWFWIICIICIVGMVAALIVGDVRTSRLNAACQDACAPQVVEVRVGSTCWCRTGDPDVIKRAK
jgi:hypothetical protein